MKKFKGLIIFFLIIAALGVYVFFLRDDFKSTRDQHGIRIYNLQKEVTILQEIKDVIIDHYVPDSIKEASRDASYTSMYAEPDGNDYWSARGAIHQTEMYIKTCVPCMYIDSLLQVKEDELKELQN